MEVDIEAQLEAMGRLEALKKEKEVLLVIQLTAFSPQMHVPYVTFPFDAVFSSIQLTVWCTTISRGAPGK
jgi:hypothetical protein